MYNETVFDNIGFFVVRKFVQEHWLEELERNWLI